MIACGFDNKLLCQVLIAGDDCEPTLSLFGVSQVTPVFCEAKTYLTWEILSLGGKDLTEHVTQYPWVIDKFSVFLILYTIRVTVVMEQPSSLLNRLFTLLRLSTGFS